MQRQFVGNGSIVRTIWGDADIVLLVFAGCAAEFALNRAVDWLFFTGRLPNDPVGRLFTTAKYAQQIVFTDETMAQNALERIRTIHGAVERQRGQRIPEWAHRDVLYMLIDYSEKAYQLFHRPLTSPEQDELYDVFHRVGAGLGISGLPSSYSDWRVDRESHLKRDLVNSDGTMKLYERYHDQLGAWRFDLLLQVQALLVPDHVRGLLQLDAAEWLRPIAKAYPLLARAGLRSIIHQVLLPSRYLSEVRGLDHRPRRRRARLRLSLAP